MKNKDVKNWLSFSKKERNALILLAGLVGLFFAIPRLVPKKEIPISFVDSTAISHKSPIDSVNATNILFPFDPNILDADGWKKLGLRDKTISTIIHYREKGGRFRKPEDIRKIYGLRQEEADKLVPFVRIGTLPETNVLNDFGKNKSSNTANYSFPIEVNKAGADHWAALPGISSGLAQRIVNYRNAIKGFKSVDQVGKTYGLSPDVFARIKPLLRLTKDTPLVETSNSDQPFTQKDAVAANANTISNGEKININTASEQDFLSQKRIPRNVAKAIVIYREQHGPYQEVVDIKKIVFINDDIYERVAPCLKVE